LVTGGAGFIGSNIVAGLCRQGTFDVAVCDRLRVADLGKWRNLAKHAISDFVAPEGLWPWLETHHDDLDAVIHMGAVSSTTETDADKIIHSNFGLSRDLFRWCADRGKRLIYASSAATYGDGALGFDDAQDIAALQSLRPLNAYGWSKALFDLYARREAEHGAAPPHWVGLKFFNVYGPNEAHKGAMRSVVSQIWPDAAAGRAIKLFRSYRSDYPDGGQLRDFVYVDDIVRVVLWILQAEPASGVYNLGSGQARSFEDLARAVFRAVNREPAIVYVDMPEGLREKYQYFTEARMDRLRALGFQTASTTLEDGVADYVRHYLSRDDPYR
jgi:ADP-L-glycero-D-manno-heptose 6-epimerase